MVETDIVIHFSFVLARTLNCWTCGITVCDCFIMRFVYGWSILFFCFILKRLNHREDSGLGCHSSIPEKNYSVKSRTIAAPAMLVCKKFCVAAFVACEG